MTGQWQVVTDDEFPGAGTIVDGDGKGLLSLFAGTPIIRERLLADRICAFLNGDQLVTTERVQVAGPCVVTNCYCKCTLRTGGGRIGTGCHACLHEIKEAQERFTGDDIVSQGLETAPHLLTQGEVIEYHCDVTDFGDYLFTQSAVEELIERRLRTGGES